jgi:hypothetical protein
VPGHTVKTPISGQQKMNLWDPHGNQAASSRAPVQKHLFSAHSHSVKTTEKKKCHLFLKSSIPFWTSYLFSVWLPWKRRTTGKQSVPTSLIQPTGPEPTVSTCVIKKLETDSGNISVFSRYILLSR